MATLENMDREAFQAFMREYTHNERAAFVALCSPVFERFCRQLEGGEASFEKRSALFSAVWDAARAYGFPAPLAAGERGVAGRIDDSLLAEALDRILAKAAISEDVLDRRCQRLFAKQLLKTVIMPEFKSCRLSYQEKDATGYRRRQDIENCKSRISGSNCVDCPLYTDLIPRKQLKVLKISWGGETWEELDENIDVFLPDDFRELRRFLHLRARYGKKIRARRPAGVA